MLFIVISVNRPITCTAMLKVSYKFCGKNNHIMQSNYHQNYLSLSILWLIQKGQPVLAAAMAANCTPSNYNNSSNHLPLPRIVHVMNTAWFCLRHKKRRQDKSRHTSGVNHTRLLLHSIVGCQCGYCVTTCWASVWPHIFKIHASLVLLWGVPQACVQLFPRTITCRLDIEPLPSIQLLITWLSNQVDLIYRPASFCSLTQLLFSHCVTSDNNLEIWKLNICSTTPSCIFMPLGMINVLIASNDSRIFRQNELVIKLSEYGG